MQRPTVLVAEPEPEQALSVRKLVLETAKFNVLTAHSTREAIDIFHTFPNISAAVLSAVNGINAEKIAKNIKMAAGGKIPVVILSPRVGAKSAIADRVISSHEPETLLVLMRSLLGDPREMENGEK